MNANRRSVIVSASVALLLASLWIALSVIPATATEHVYYFHNDHLGTPQAMSDASGRKVWEAEYEPFGKAAVNQDPDGDGQVVINNLRFPGQYYDAETGLHYNYHRDYDPATGRYLQPDPIGLDGGMNLYAYVAGNPVFSIDPSGLDIYLMTGNKNASWQVGNRFFHQEICVDTWKKCGDSCSEKGPKQCFSFAAMGVGFSGPSQTWLGRPSANSGGPLIGEVYPTGDQGISVSKTLKTTCKQDQDFFLELSSMIGMRGTYSLGRHSCRTFSQMMFEEAQGLYGH